MAEMNQGDREREHEYFPVAEIYRAICLKAMPPIAFAHVRSWLLESGVNYPWNAHRFCASFALHITETIRIADGCNPSPKD